MSKRAYRANTGQVETTGEPNGGVRRPSPNEGVVARREVKVYFSLPHACPEPDAPFMSHGRSELPLIPRSLCTRVSPV